MENYFKRKVIGLLDFMYGKPVGETIGSVKLGFMFSHRTNRLKSIYSENKLLAIARSDGYILLQREGLKLFTDCAGGLQRKTVVSNDAKPFILEGKDVFAPFILSFIGEHHIGEDSIICSENMEPLGCGQLLLLPSEAKFFKRGIAIKVRFGLGRNCDATQQ
jgi:predicted RNA-binding protein (TIGR00451 family)